MGTGCFFWEADECTMSDVMCGSENLINADVKENLCKRFIYFFNHANDHCSIDEEKLAEYQMCFWEELNVHIPDRSKCPTVCSDSHGHLPHEIEVCHTQCVHVHDCVDQCKDKEKYKFRDAIVECFDTCMKRSPVNPVGTCIGSCGSHSPNHKCHCDPTCSFTNDCCEDYQNYCLVTNMRWNESVGNGTAGFTLPSFNITAKDVKNYDSKHTVVADKTDTQAEVDRRVAAALSEEKREKGWKKRRGKKST